MMHNIKHMIFWGATGHAKVLRECMKDSELQLLALFDQNDQLVSPFPQVPLYQGKSGFEQWLSQRLSDEAVGFLVAIGGDKGRDRIEIQEYLESFGLIPLTARHRTAFIADDAQVGAGSQILAQAAVCVEATLGRSCIINTAATVDHECCLGDGVHVGPGAHLAGCVAVGSYTMIGTGATILPRIKLGEGVIVGAGAVVTRDVPMGKIVKGIPAC
jgi:sugar O-acyltransferase (sialic acid O-acetyltransferase NeuD family)